MLVIWSHDHLVIILMREKITIAIVLRKNQSDRKCSDVPIHIRMANLPSLIFYIDLFQRRNSDTIHWGNSPVKDPIEIMILLVTLVNRVRIPYVVIYTEFTLCA